MKRLIPFLLLLTGCATVTDDPLQKITITTEPAGAACTASNRERTVEIKKAPATVEIPRSYSPLVINCALNGAKATRTLEPETSNRAWGNLLMLGVPAVVDAATEIGYRYNPENVTLRLKKY